MFFLDLRVVFNNIIVAMQTFFHGWDSRKIRVSHRRVAVLALNLFDPDMDIMAEGYRLLRSDAG